MALYEITSEDIPVDFEMTMATDIVKRTIQNAKNLLMTRMGEIPFDRQRGLDPAIFDLPYDEAEAVIVQELDRVMLWEPDVEVNNGWLEIRNGETIVHCVIEIEFDE